MSNPVLLDVKAIDLGHFETCCGEIVTMRLHDATGLRIDVPLPREAAGAFGAALEAYAS